MRDKSPLAGLDVPIKSTSGLLKFCNDKNPVIRIEDWWENVGGRSWMLCDGNPACLYYALRVGLENIPINNDVLYGKIGGMGYLANVSELDLEE